MCDCYERNMKALKEQFGEDVEFYEGVTYLSNLTTGKGEHVMGLMRFRFHPKKTDGSHYKTWQKTFLNPTYCPMCGEKRKREG